MKAIDWIMLWTLSLLWGGSFLFNELALAGLAEVVAICFQRGVSATASPA